VSLLSRIISRITPSSKFFSDLWSLARPYWLSEERWIARGLVAMVVGLSLTAVYITVLVNHWNAAFYNALQEFNRAEFFRQLLIFAGLTAANVVVAVYQVYFNQMLQIRWRRWLTEHFLDDWLANQTYYRMALQRSGTDNPDQRISEDMGLFVVYTTSFSLGILSAVVTLTSFVAILWGLSGTLMIPLGRVGTLPMHGYMVWAALFYAVGGTWLTVIIGRPLVQLSFDQQRYEADFRFSLARFRDNAESIALYRGEAGERVRFRDRFGDILRNYRSTMERQKRLTSFTWAFGQLALVFPILVAAPRYFIGQLQLGGLMQTAQAFKEVQGSLSFIINSYPEIARWQAVVDRLVEFRDTMHAVADARSGTPRIEIVRDGRPGIHIQQLSLNLPDGTPLLTDFDATVPPGGSLFISGPSGSGKTTLLRAISGIWPFGRGRIELPDGQHTVTIPHQPYLPLGTLRRTLTGIGSSETDEQPPTTAAAAADDTELLRVLSLCGLGYLAERLDEEENWAQSLSPSEQTCLAFARLLVLRPDSIFLDEVTSAVDETTEANLYGVLRDELPNASVISVGHRETLSKLHDQRIELQPRSDREVT